MMFREAMNYFYTKHFRVSNLVKVWIKMAINAFSFLKRISGPRSIQKRTRPYRYCLVSDTLSLEIGVNKNIPFREFKIKNINEEVLGELFSYFILLLLTQANKSLQHVNYR